MDGLLYWTKGGNGFRLVFMDGATLFVTTPALMNPKLMKLEFATGGRDVAAVPSHCDSLMFMLSGKYKGR